MRKPALIALMTACAAMPLAACATYDAGPGPGSVAYDGFYDGYYGSIYDGYWGDGDMFYYRAHGHGRYRPDTNHHFRRDMSGSGFHPMHGMGPGPGGPHERGRP